MENIDITWTDILCPGKYNEDGTRKEVPRVSLPFQVIETVNESRETREARKGGTQAVLFDIWEGKEGEIFEEGWKDNLIWGNNTPNRKIESHRLQISEVSNIMRAS